MACCSIEQVAVSNCTRHRLPRYITTPSSVMTFTFWDFIQIDANSTSLDLPLLYEHKRCRISFITIGSGKNRFRLVK